MAAALALASAPRSGHAVCNVIPAATGDFRAAVGGTNRPFASPGDYVEVRLRPAVCDGESTGFVDLDQDGSRSDDHLVTVLFTPPNGPANAVVLAERCTGVGLAACDAQLGGGSATCVEVNGLLDPNGLLVSGPSELQLRFPDTDDRVGTASDDRTLAGPAKLVVTRRGAALRCDLAATRCADLGGTTLSTGVVACVDELYALDGTCRTQAAQVGSTFGHFTALPPPNDFEAMLNAPGVTELHFTTDAAGNVLVPMDYGAILLRVNDVPVPQLARAGTNVEAFPGGGTKVDLPGDGFIGSYSPEGIILPPVFTPLSDPSSPTEATLFGSVDAPRGVIRIARRGCEGGADEGQACAQNADCSTNVCSPVLFDFSTRYASGVGPISLAGGPSGAYTAVLDAPISIESVAQAAASPGTFAFVTSEAIDGVDRNGDADAVPRDPVLTLRDRETGVVRPIGPSGSDGRAIVQVREPLQTSRAPVALVETVATEGDLVAFLESEAHQGATDVNANESVFDAIVRVFRLGPTSASEITDPGAPVTAAAAREVAGRSAALSGGTLFVRTDEDAEALQETTRVSVDGGGTQGNAASYTSEDGSPFSPAYYIQRRPAASSADGRFIAFESAASNLVSGDANAVNDVFVRDRVAGTTVRASVDSGGVEGNGESSLPAISSDGRFVVFDSAATNLVSGDGNGARDVFVHDRDADEDGVFDESGAIATTRVSVTSGAVEGDGDSQEAAISADGRYVAFESVATNLVAGDTNGHGDVFLHDRASGTTTRVSVSGGGVQGNGPSVAAAISADGSAVAFATFASNLVGGDTNGTSDVFVRSGGSTTRASLAHGGLQANANSGYHSLSPDARYVMFTSAATDLVANDTNGVRDVFIHDRIGQGTTRVSVDSLGGQGDGHSEGGSMSADGRFVVFRSSATNLVPGDTNARDDVFLRDLITGTTTRISLGSGGAEGSVHSWEPAISPDGRFVVFESNATNLVPGDTNGATDVFVRGLDPADPLGADRSGDGSLDDTLLRVVDTSVGPPASVTDLCPAGETAVAAGRAAFLRPESAGTSGSAACTGGALTGPDLNADADAEDEVVHLWDGTSVTNLRCAADAVALSATRLAALVSEAGEGTDLNGDADPVPDDLVLHVRAATGAGAGATCSASGWTDTGQAADALTIANDLVAIAVSEAAQGAGSLNGDADTADRVLRLVDATTGGLLDLYDPQGALDPTPEAVSDFVLGESLVAFRTPEASQGQDLNGDGDLADEVLQVIDLGTRQRRSSGQAAAACQLAACDPTRPYRVSQDSVRFLTYETEQGGPTPGGPVECDLNDDGDCTDLLVQLFNVASGETEVVAEVAQTSTAEDPSDPTPSADPLASPDESDPDAGTQQVVVSAGRCAALGATDCASDPAVCAAGELCLSDGLGGYRCGTAAGTCTNDDACPADLACVPDPVVLGVSDRDRDQVPDGLDNCPTASNTDQEDADGDGVGDACDLQTCGDGAPQLQEECDDGNLMSGDGCDGNCTDTACGNGIQTAGEACDDGNLLNGDGCSSTCTVATAGQVAPLAGKLLLVKDKDGDATKRKIVFLSKDPNVVTPLAGAGDPTQAGGELVLRNPTTSEEIALALPGSHWTGLGNPAGSKGWIYKDLGFADGPCKVVVAKPGKLLRAVCLGSQIGFTLDEAQQGSLAATLQIGADPPQCVAFAPPKVIEDRPAQAGGTGLFKGLDGAAPALASCPAP